MGLFGNDSIPQQSGMNLGMTGAPAFGQQNGYMQQSQPNMFGQQNAFGAQGGMGGAFAQGMGVPNQPVAPPSETEILIHLMNANVPVEKWLAGPNFQNVVNMLTSLVTLCIHNYFKEAKFMVDEDGNLQIDVASLPSDVQTVSTENVLMDLQRVQSAAQQSVQNCQMTQQQIAAIAQQSMMHSAFGAAMAEPGMMQNVGNFARGIITGGR
jgi:hypothetical protein